MSYCVNDLNRLAAQARLGDAGAVVALRRELQPHMLRIVRRALRSTTGPSAVTQRVQVALDRLSARDSGQPASDPERLVHRVARDICESLIGRLQAPQPHPAPLRDTVRN